MTSIKYTETQLKIMAILPVISAPLSIIGSSLIVYKILSDRKRKLARMYNRILLGFSISDIISSSAYSFSTLPSPSDTSDIWGARGNDTTCAIQGFLIQTGFSVIYYNSLLVFYYLLSIRYGVSELTLKKYLEPWIHIFILFMATIPSILGMILGMFNNVGNVCFVGEYPKGCTTNDEIECERGEMSYLFLMVTSGWLVIFLFIALPINLVIICCTLSKQFSNVEMKYKYNSTQATLPIPHRESSSNRNIIEILKRRQSRLTKASYHIQKTRTQAMCYIVSSFLCLAFPLILRNIREPGSMFIIRCLAQFFYPLQGFFNFFNYTRPRVLKLKEQNLATSYWNALYLATFETDDNLKMLKLKKQREAQNQREYDRRKLKASDQKQIDCPREEQFMER